jgi:predicted ATPase
MPHHLTADCLRGLAGVRAEASEAEVAEALAAALRDTLGGGAAGEVYPFLGHLMNLHLGAEDAARMRYLEGPALQAQYVASLRRFLRGLAAKQPVVITLEDVHWADPSSAELLTQVLPVAAEAPLVVAVVARPEKDVPGWRLVDGARQSKAAPSLELALTPLTGDDSCELVGNLLEVNNLPDSVRDVILQKAEGNPFFVEEVIRMLIDRGGITRDPESGAWTDSGVIESIEIPDTLQGVLAARIDRLPEDAKRMLQVASVIGRKFQVSVLQHVLRDEGAR